LLNEFPDYEADGATGKKNLLYRIGKFKGKMLYITFNALTCVTMMMSPLFGVSAKVIFFYFPFLLIALYLIFLMIKNRHEDARKLEVMCGLNIAVNVGTALAYILAYI